MSAEQEKTKTVEEKIETSPEIQEQKSSSPDAALQGRCLTCRKLVDFIDTRFSQTKNNRTRAEGKCAHCGKSVSKFVKKQ